MNMTLLRALVALVPASVLFAGSCVVLIRRGRLSALLQLLGAASIVVVVLIHICEALQLFPAMRWGSDQSLGHYLDLTSAVFGATLFPVGYLLHALVDPGCEDRRASAR